MLEFSKFEKDPNLSQLLKDQLKEALQEARMMETVLTQIPERDDEDDTSQKKSKSVLSLLTKPKALKKMQAQNKKELTDDEEIYIEERFLCLEKFEDWDSITDTFVKRNLEEVILSPLKYQNIFSSLENSWRSILIYGLPGTGKTYFLKTLASKVNGTFLWLSSCDLMSRYIGESEKILRNVFKYAIDRQPSVILIDEIDCIFHYGDGESEGFKRLRTELQIQLMDLQSQNAAVMLIGITNNPIRVGQTLKKFDRKVLIPLPDKINREAVLRKIMSKIEHNLTEEDFQMIAEKTEGYSYSDIAILGRDACFQPLRKLTKSQFFKIVEYKDNLPIYDAADENDPEAIPITLFDIPQQSIKVSKTTRDHFALSLKAIGSAISKEYAEQFEKETRELFGGVEKDE